MTVKIHEESSTSRILKDFYQYFETWSDLTGISNINLRDKVSY